MKRKDDFITNSSSTSYVVACYKKINIDKDSPTFELLNDLVEGFDLANTEEEVKQLFYDQYGDDLNDKCKKCIDIVNNGGSIITASIPYDVDVEFPTRIIRKYGGEVIVGE